MKRLFSFSFLFLALGVAQAQTVDEVLAKHYEAIGGLDKWKSLQSLHTEAVAIMQNGNEVSTSTWKVQGKLSRTERNFGMGSMTTVVTDKGAWSMSPRSNGAFEEVPADRYQMMAVSELDCQGALIDYAAKGHKAEFLGKETVEGTEYLKIKLTLSNGREMNYFINPSTYYIDRMSFKGGGMGMGGGRPGGGGGQGPGGGQRDPNAETVIKYSKYEKTPEGLVFAFTVMPGFGGEQTYEKIEVNPKVDDKMYQHE